MKKRIQIIIDMDISYPYLDESQSVIDQLDLGLSNIFPVEKSIIPILYTMRDDKVLDTRTTVKHQGSGSISIQIKRDETVAGKQRFDELADDF